MIRKFKNKIFRKVLGNGYNCDNILWNKRLIFVHVPKNAGTSIYSALGMDKSFHYSLKDYESMIRPAIYNSLYKFTIVRNPYARFISLYNYARLDESEHHSAINPKLSKYGKHLDYDILKKSSLSEAIELLLENKLVHDHSSNHWKPQITWLKDRKGGMPDLIGKLEDMRSFSREFKGITGINLNLNHMNKSTSGRDQVDSLTLSDKKKLHSYYIEDFVTFNYSTEL